jgi:hypothetical protein
VLQQRRPKGKKSHKEKKKVLQLLSRRKHCKEENEMDEVKSDHGWFPRRHHP